MNGYAASYEYKNYRHEAFRHLEFDIPKEWYPIQNGLEVVFTNREETLPQLFFQTLGKTEEYSDPASFLQFLKTVDPEEEFKNIETTWVGRFPSISYEYQEADYPRIYVYGLVIDAGEGLIWFYLKGSNDDSFKAVPHPIMEHLKETLDFR